MYEKININAVTVVQKVTKRVDLVSYTVFFLSCTTIIVVTKTHIVRT